MDGGPNHDVLIVRDSNPNVSAPNHTAAAPPDEALAVTKQRRRRHEEVVRIQSNRTVTKTINEILAVTEEEDLMRVRLG
jgi:hypothetical protein